MLFFMRSIINKVEGGIFRAEKLPEMNFFPWGNNIMGVSPIIFGAKPVTKGAVPLPLRNLNTVLWQRLFLKAAFLNKTDFLQNNKK